MYEKEIEEILRKHQDMIQALHERVEAIENVFIKFALRGE